MNTFKKIMISTVALASLASTQVMASKTITVTGSNSITSLMEILAETYSKESGNFVEVQGPGSSAGIRAANDKTAMIGMASREVAADEINANIKVTPMAHDAIAVIVHPSKSKILKTLTIDQLSAIYRNEIKNWADVGAQAGPVVAVTRDSASGTRAGFEGNLGLIRKVNGIKVSAISPRVRVANSNGAIKTMVASNPNAIGYISLGTVDNTVSALAINGIEPSVQSVQNNQYPITRNFNLLLSTDVDTSALEYLKWILSEDGQKIIADKGYVPVS